MEQPPLQAPLAAPSVLTASRETDATPSVPRLVAQLHAIVRELELLYPGRKFTPDGHLVGSLGEVLAAAQYGLTLLPHSAAGHDALDRAGRRVQIKATQGKSVALRSEPDFLLVLRLLRDGQIQEIYNGPGRLPWEASGRRQSNGQSAIGFGRLSRLNSEVLARDRIGRTD
jgi:hypothetical protein